MRVLLTRPIDDARRSATRLRALGHQAVLSPVIEIVALPCVLPRQAFEAVALTSAHAAQFLSPADIARLASLPAFAVGARSGAAARAAGLMQVWSADGDETALAALLARRLPVGASVLYLAGRERKGRLEAALQDAGLRCQLAETYQAAPATTLTREAIAALRRGDLDAALHYSARSAKILLALARTAGLHDALFRLRHLCLSADVAAELPEAARAMVAATPTEVGLVGLLAQTELGSVIK